MSQDDECKHVENHVKKVNNAMGNLSLSSFICHIKGHWNNTSLFSTDFLADLPSWLYTAILSQIYRWIRYHKVTVNQQRSVWLKAIKASSNYNQFHGFPRLY